MVAAVDKVPEFDVEMRLRNNRIRAWRETQQLSCEDAAKLANICVGVLKSYENLTTDPRSKSSLNGWRPTALKLASKIGLSPEEIWTEEILAVVKNTIRFQVTGNSIRQLCGDASTLRQLNPEDAVTALERRTVIDNALNTLTPREQEIVLMYYNDGLTLGGIGVLQGIQSSRVQQIICKSLRKMRHSSKCKYLKEHINDDDDLNYSGASIND